VAARFSPVPIINAGDGGHNHPTQTLADLLTIRREKGQLSGLTVASAAICSLAALCQPDQRHEPLSGYPLCADLPGELRIPRLPAGKHG
jgi:hypothetical protein